MTMYSVTLVVVVVMVIVGLGTRTDASLHCCNSDSKPSQGPAGCLACNDDDKLTAFRIDGPPSLRTIDDYVAGKRWEISGDSGSCIVERLSESYDCFSEVLCRDKLGLEDGRVKDSQLSASSWDQTTYPEFNPEHCAPYNGRLNQAWKNGIVGGWCPEPADFDTSWFQVDMERPMKVSGVILQGIDAHVYSWHGYVESYRVQYGDSPDDLKYIMDEQTQSPKEFAGAHDDDAPVTSIFETPVTARYIRIVPASYHEWLDMRAEILVCKDTSNCDTSLQDTNDLFDLPSYCPDSDEYTLK